MRKMTELWPIPVTVIAKGRLNLLRYFAHLNIFYGAKISEIRLKHLVAVSDSYINIFKSNSEFSVTIFQHPYFHPSGLFFTQQSSLPAVAYWPYGHSGNARMASPPLLLFYVML